jgi:hypothetical protein
LPVSRFKRSSACHKFSTTLSVGISLLSTITVGALEFSVESAAYDWMLELRVERDTSEELREKNP